MAFISVFDVLGPNMIGPSSSHTAGAEIIAYLAQKMIAPPLKRVDFTLYGSFAKTYHGHGTDRALLGGIMGFSANDPASGTLSPLPPSGVWLTALPPTRPRPTSTPTRWISVWRTRPGRS